MAQATTIINKFGKLQGWNCITLTIMGRDLEGITELSYDDAVKKENVYAAGKFPVGRGEGNYEAKFSMTLLKEEVDAIRKSLPPGKRIQDIAAFNAPVEYQLENGALQRDRIMNAEFMNSGVDVKQNDGSIATKFDMLVSHIDWNV